MTIQSCQVLHWRHCWHQYALPSDEAPPFEDVAVRPPKFAHNRLGQKTYNKCGDHTNFNATHDEHSCYYFWESLAEELRERETLHSTTADLRRAVMAHELAEKTVRLLLEVPETEVAEVMAAVNTAVAEGKLSQELVDERIHDHPEKQGAKVILLRHTLMSAKDDTMLRNMYLHAVYHAATRSVLEYIFPNVEDDTWLKGDDSTSYFSEPLMPQASLMIDTFVGHDMSSQKCFASSGGEAERIVTDGVACIYPLRRVLGNFAFRSPQTGLFVTPLQKRDMIRNHVMKAMRAGGLLQPLNAWMTVLLSRHFHEKLTAVEKSLLHVAKSKGGLGVRPVDWQQNTLQRMGAAAEIGSWMSQLFPNYMSNAFVNWEITRHPQLLQLLQEHPPLKHMVRGWKELLSSGNLVAVLPGKVQKHDRQKALGLVELTSRAASDMIDADLCVVVPFVEQCAEDDIQQMLQVLNLQRKKVEVHWSPREQAQRMVFSSIVKDVTIIAQAAQLLGTKGHWCQQVEQAAALLGAKTGNFCAVCEPVLTYAAIGQLLRGKAQSEELQVPGLPAEVEQLAISMSSAAAWRACCLLMEKRRLAKPCQLLQHGRKRKKLSSIVRKVQFQDFCKLEREYMQCFFRLFWNTPRLQMYGRH